MSGKKTLCGNGSVRTEAKDGLTVKQGSLADARRGRNEKVILRVDQPCLSVRLRLKRRSLLNELTGKLMVAWLEFFKGALLWRRKTRVTKLVAKSKA